MDPQPVAAIYISPRTGDREIDDWGHELPVGRTLLFPVSPGQYTIEQIVDAAIFAEVSERQIDAIKLVLAASK